MTSYSFVCLKLLYLLVITFSSRSYPRFRHDGNVLQNNSYLSLQQIGQVNFLLQSDIYALGCMTDGLKYCCKNGKGKWYNRKGKEITNYNFFGSSNLYVTRGDGVVYLNRRDGGSSGMWRCDIPDSDGVLKSVYIYLGKNNRGT